MEIMPVRLVLCTTAILLSGCNSEYTVRPGDVKIVNGLASEAQGYQGSFEIALANSGEPFVESKNGIGGACLVVQNRASPGICNTDADCKVAPYRDADGILHEPVANEAYGYCLPYHNLPQVKTCWLKPSEKHCLKIKPPGTYVTPIVSSKEAHDFLGRDKPLAWRVLACVNGIDADGEKPPACGETDPPPGERLELPGRERPLRTEAPTNPPPLTGPFG